PGRAGDVEATARSKHPVDRAETRTQKRIRLRGRVVRDPLPRRPLLLRAAATLVADPVGRVGPDNVDLFTAGETLDLVRVCRIAAQQPVSSELVHLARLRV